MVSGGIASALGAATLPPNLRHGASVTLAFFVVYYAFILRQIIVKTKLRRRYHEQDKKVIKRPAGVIRDASDGRL